MPWSRILFGGWEPLARTALVGVAAYLTLVVMLRLSGKRTLSKFNAFDFVVTIAIGSTLATVLTSREVALAQGVVALAVLLALQFAITWGAVRSGRVRRLVKGSPVLLAHRGEFLDGVLRGERVTREEVLAAARANGAASLAEIESAVLETDGTITVVRRSADVEPSALSGVVGYPPRHRSP